jgi:hypothetical protein
VRLPFKVKLIFGIGAVTVSNGYAKRLHQLYIACGPEQTARFWAVRRFPGTSCG